MHRLLYSEYFWKTIFILLIIWIIYAVGHNAIVTAKYNPVGFLALAGPFGVMGIIGMLGPGFIPGILLVVALTMRNRYFRNKKPGRYDKGNKL